MRLLVVCAVLEPGDRRVAAHARLRLVAHDAHELSTRLAALTQEMPEVNWRSVLQRRPQLLGCKPATLREALLDLSAVMPDQVDAYDLVQKQPSLLNTSPDRLQAKLCLLRTLGHPISLWMAMV